MGLLLRCDVVARADEDQGHGPNASRLLAAAVANCLTASLLFCLRKARVNVHGMRSEATATVARDGRAAC